MSAGRVDALVEDLAQKGWSLTDDLFGRPHVLELQTRALELFSSQQMRQASVGRGGGVQRPDIRSDWIYWIENWEATTSLRQFSEFIGHFTQALREKLWVQAKSFEAHFAAYPPGAFYARHVDHHLGSQHRQISCVFYLTDWRKGDGGELCLYPHDETYVIEPKAGRFVCFISRNLMHEVRLSRALRLSLTGWVRDDLKIALD